MQDASRNISGDRQAAGRRSTLRVGGAVCLIAAVTSWVVAAPAAPNRSSEIAALPEEVTVRLYASAVIAGDDVTLRDVAEISGNAEALIGAWTIAAAPHPGQSGALELSQLQSILARRGVNLSTWVFRGNSRCTIKRLANETNHRREAGASSQQQGAAPNVARTQTVSAAIPAATQPANAAPAVNPNTLEGVIREHIARRIKEIGGEAVVRFSPGAGRILALAKPTYDFRIADHGERMLGMVSLDVTVLEGGQPRQTVPILADVSLRKAVVVATRPINRGETIHTGDLQLEPRTFEHVEDLGLSNVKPLIGQRAKKFVDVRSIVQARDLEPVPLVMRNDLVTVIARRGGLVVRGSAKAMSSAGFGDTITLKNENSKETFTGVVTGEKTVEVSDKPTTVASATVGK